MAKALITLVFRQVIDETAKDNFAKNILHYSYEEFKLKSQTYNQEGKFKNFTEMKEHDGRANSLHYKSGFAVAGFIDALKNKIPVITDTLDQPIDFDGYKFEVIESDIKDNQLHKVAIYYSTAPLMLHEIIGEQLLLSYQKTDTASAADTFLIKLQPGLSIETYQQLMPSNNIRSAQATLR